MNTTTKILITAAIGLIIGAGGAMAFIKPGYDRSEMGVSNGHMMPNGHMMGGTGMGMQDEMASMNAALQSKTGDAFDQAFLTEMTMHHQGAVQMAQAALKDAKHQEIKDLALKIITAQNAEIKQMQDWKTSWYGN